MIVDGVDSAARRPVPDWPSGPAIEKSMTKDVSDFADFFASVEQLCHIDFSQHAANG